jgi:hypothetical protein
VLYTPPAGTYTVSLPQNWIREERTGNVTEVHSPGDRNEFIRLIAGGPGSNALAELNSEERGFRSRYPTYSKIGLGIVEFRGYNAADWEFTFEKDGARKHVLYRLFVANGLYYGIYLSAPEDAFGGLRPQFDTAAETFALKSPDVPLECAILPLLCGGS